jgi:phage/plasmid-like protein (TIGR03299 family)
MAHEIDNSTGIYAFAAVGGSASAWHGLGQSIERGDSIDTITQKAGLNWNANRAPVIYNTSDGRAMSFENQSVLYRSDTGAALGVVSENRYNVHQPREIMEFFADFLSDNGLQIETAGAVRGGRIVWCMAKLGPDYGFLMPGGDAVDSYIRLQTSFDGSRATDLVATTVRQVCANTMRMVDRDALEKGYKNKHSTQFDSAGLARAFGLLGEQHRITSEQWHALARIKVDNKTALDFLAGLLDINPADIGKVDGKGSKIVSTKAENNLRALVTAYRKSPGANLASADGTAYGLLNAVTYYVDHAATVRDTENDGARGARFASTQLGAGDALKQKALKALASQYAIAA